MKDTGGVLRGESESADEGFVLPDSYLCLRWRRWAENHTVTEEAVHTSGHASRYRGFSQHPCSHYIFCTRILGIIHAKLKLLLRVLFARMGLKSGLH